MGDELALYPWSCGIGCCHLLQWINQLLLCAVHCGWCRVRAVTALEQGWATASSQCCTG